MTQIVSSKKIVSKFGGSSMADYKAMIRSAKIVKEQSSLIVLVSATYKTTDVLVSLIDNAQFGNWNECEKTLFQLREKHFEICQDITKAQDDNQVITEQLRLFFNELETLIRGVFLLQECSLRAKDQILSFGERISSLLFSEVLKSVMHETDKNVQLFDSRTILKTDSHHGCATPLVEQIRTLANENINKYGSIVYVGQGFIGSDDTGATTTLGRGGSDYSASLMAEAINADILEIWTDVAGIATTDPRVCSQALPINEISYDEASEMAQYGAKVLHPTTLVPAMRQKIPVFVGSSLDRDKEGTWIKEKANTTPLIRAIAKRSNQAMLMIRTPKMLNAFGFMSRIFNVFEKYRISVDCVTTSEISVAVTVEQTTINNSKFLNELREIGDVQFETGYALVSLIGNNITETSGVAQDIFNSIEGLNVRMMCLGASDYNFNFLVSDDDSEKAIQNLHNKFIGCCNENSTAR
jgi:aspartate kinase